MRAILLLAFALLTSSAAATSPVPAVVVPDVQVLCECADLEVLAVGTAEYAGDNTLGDDCTDTVAVVVKVVSDELLFEIAGSRCVANGFWDFYCESSEDGTLICVEDDGPEWGVGILRPSGEFHFYADAEGDVYRLDGQVTRVL